VLLVLVLLGGGLVLLLLLNAASAADSFRQRSLQSQLSALSLQEQDLQRQVANLQAPQALARAALRLGLVPSGDPGFIVLRPDGSYRVLGTPAPAADQTRTRP
jgi:cell division protein FtsB